MNKEVGFTRPKLALLLLGGLLSFVAVIAATYTALVHWHVH